MATEKLIHKMFMPLYWNLECGHTYRTLPYEATKDQYFCPRCGEDKFVFSSPSDKGDLLRRTGRTTRMLEDVLIQCGGVTHHIIVCACTLNYACMLHKVFCNIIHQRGLESGIEKISSKQVVYRGTTVDFVSSSSNVLKNLPEETAVFYDHYQK